MKSWYLIQNREGADNKPAELTIYDEIGAWGITAKEFDKDFKAIKAEKVKLAINSPGGSVFEAVAIFNTLKMSGKTIDVTVMGIAASAASYIAMAGDSIEMPENTFMFLHDPINGLYGDADDMRDMAALLDKIGLSLVQTYAKRSGQTDEQVQALLKADSMMTAAECLAAGLCDKVTAPITATARFEVDRFPTNVQAIFKKTDPAALADANKGVMTPEAVITACEQAGLKDYASTFALDPAMVSKSAVDAALAVAKDVIALCAVAKKPELAAKHVKARTTVVDVRKELQALVAAEDEKTNIDTTPNPNAKKVDDPHAISVANVWAKRREQTHGKPATKQGEKA